MTIDEIAGEESKTLGSPCRLGWLMQDNDLVTVCAYSMEKYREKESDYVDFEMMGVWTSCKPKDREAVLNYPYFSHGLSPWHMAVEFPKTYRRLYGKFNHYCVSVHEMYKKKE